MDEKARLLFLGLRLLRYREKLGLTQLQLSIESGVGQASISDYERGVRAMMGCGRRAGASIGKPARVGTPTGLTVSNVVLLGLVCLKLNVCQSGEETYEPGEST